MEKTRPGLEPPPATGKLALFLLCSLRPPDFTARYAPGEREQTRLWPYASLSVPLYCKLYAEECQNPVKNVKFGKRSRRNDSDANLTRREANVHRNEGKSRPPASG
jgi:hypothetical protein